MTTLGPQAPFKPSMVYGINDAALDSGLLRPWPNEKVGFEVCAQLAARLQGPDVLPEAGLSKESALGILQELKIANERLFEAGHKPSLVDLYQIKQAATLEPLVRAARIAEAYMAKAASEGGSLTNVGENTPESAAHDNQLAKLDLRNRGAAEYLVGVGNSELPTGGIVGKEMPHPKKPSNTASISNSLTAHTAKAAAEKNASDAMVKAKQLLLQARHTPGSFVKEHPLLSAGAAGALGGGAYAAGKAIHNARNKEASANIEADLAALALGTKTANEDMAMGDLAAGTPAGAPAGGGDPAKMERLHAMLSALTNQYHHAPSPEGQLAAAGLAEHPDGMQVMASVLETAKTAEEADDILQQILHHQGQAGHLASPELIAAIQALLEQQGGGEMGGETSPEDQAAMAAPGAEAPTAPPPSPEDKMASLMADLKKLAEGGSLTGVGKNTPEAAAKDNQLAKLDQKNRSTKTYLEGQGGTSFPNKGQQYAVQKNDAHESPVHTDTVPSRETTKNASKTNGNGASKAASVEKLSPEDEEYIAELKKIAELYGPKLPVQMPQKEKIAAIQQLHARPPRDRAAFLQSLVN